MPDIGQIRNRLKHGWNLFKNEEKDPKPVTQNSVYSFNLNSTSRPDRKRVSPKIERTILASIYNRIAIDVAAIDIKHVRVDTNDIYRETIMSSLNECLSTEANIDQTGRELILDAVLSLLDEGCVAIVPVDTSVDLLNNGAYDIHSIRTGRIIEWMPRHVKIDVYNDRTGLHQEVMLPKDKVAIIENPLYSVMNEPNSTLKRLINKLNLLDVTDEQNASTKLDLIIQLPYTIKSETRQEQAEKRRKMIEDQLRGTQYGIAYVDSTERITQLNRSVDNNLLTQIQSLTTTLYSQLGMTEEVLKGTANEETMLNYYNRTIEPILSALTDEMKRKFLTKTERTQGQSIMYFRDPFRLVPVNQIAEIADKFTRNEICTSNEMRAIVGLKPSDDPRADELRNKNLNASDQQLADPLYANPEDHEENGYDQFESGY